MLLAGDVGGTKTLLGLFEPPSHLRRFGEPGPDRPQVVATREFQTLEFDDLIAIVEAFLGDRSIRRGPIGAACFGVAGPVIGDTAELTNVPWRVDASRVRHEFKVQRVSLLNDLQAMAYAVPVLDGSELHTLQAGQSVAGGNMALIAAGTGLGESLLHNVNGRFIPSPCEGGHADFPARNEREITLVRALVRQFGRASVEHVVSGRGLVNIYRVTHTGGSCPAVPDLDDPGAPAAISAAALDRRCRECAEALEIFVEAYGAEAGNLALRSVSTGGVFIGGGIAPKILSALADGRFMTAFREKAPFRDLLAAMPVTVILNADAGLLGAAVFAANSEHERRTA